MADKKKTIVLGALGAVILGVGAFQFMGGSAPAPAAAEKKSSKAADAVVEDKPVAKNPQFANLFPQRDPFKQPDIPELRPTPAPTQPAPADPTPRSSGRRWRGDGGNDYSVPPYAPLNGQLPEANPAGPNGPIPGGQPGGMAIEPAPGYTVSGMITGHKPMAVIRDGQGNERLVGQGGSLDADTKVISIEKGKVKLSRKGKTIELQVGGTPNGN